MVDEARVEAFIAHYADANYDPAKAHEYYMENRELKTKSGSKAKQSPAQRASKKQASAANRELAKSQREASSATKKQLGEQRKSELSSAQEAQKARLENLKQDMEKRSAAIQEKLTQLIDKLVLKAQGTKAPNLNKIPPNASPKVKAYLQAQNAIMTQAAKQKAAEEFSVASSDARKVASEELAKVGAGFKDAINNARAAYTSSRAEITNRYKTAIDAETQNLKAKLQSTKSK